MHCYPCPCFCIGSYTCQFYSISFDLCQFVYLSNDSEHVCVVLFVSLSNWVDCSVSRFPTLSLCSFERLDLDMLVFLGASSFLLHSRFPVRGLASNPPANKLTTCAYRIRICRFGCPRRSSRVAMMTSTACCDRDDFDAHPSTHPCILLLLQQTRRIISSYLRAFISSFVATRKRNPSTLVYTSPWILPRESFVLRLVAKHPSWCARLVREFDSHPDSWFEMVENSQPVILKFMTTWGGSKEKTP